MGAISWLAGRNHLEIGSDSFLFFRPILRKLFLCRSTTSLVARVGGRPLLSHVNLSVVQPSAAHVAVYVICRTCAWFLIHLIPDTGGVSTHLRQVKVISCATADLADVRPSQTRGRGTGEGCSLVFPSLTIAGCGLPLFVCLQKDTFCQYPQTHLLISFIILIFRRGPAPHTGTLCCRLYAFISVQVTPDMNVPLAPPYTHVWHWCYGVDLRRLQRSPTAPQ